MLLLLSSVAAQEHAPVNHEVKELQYSCDDLASGELIIKYKNRHGKKRAPGFHRAKSEKHLRARTTNYRVNSFHSLVNLDNYSKAAKRELIPNAKLKKRRKEVLGYGMAEELEDIYLMNVEPKANMFTDWLDQAQGRVKLAKCEKLKLMIKELEADPEVEFVEPNLNYKLAGLADFATEIQTVEDTPGWKLDYSALWGLDEIGVDQAWRQSQGEGIVVAVIDSGVNYNHPDLYNNIWVNPSIVPDRNRDGIVSLKDMDSNGNGKLDKHEITPGSIGYDFFHKDFDPLDSKIGHGTHVAGIIAAESSNGIGITGAAPRAKIMPINVFSTSGQTKTTLLIKALLYAASKGADVVNMSFTGSTYSKALERTVKAVSKKMVLVAAAGNDDRDISNVSAGTIASPAGLPGVIAVGAMSNRRTKSKFSNYGYNIDFVAPGSTRYGRPNILSSDLTSSGYRVRAGTSMAAPYVAGAAAVLLSKSPQLKVDEIVNRLRLDSLEIESSQNLGAGLIQLNGAIDASNRLPRVALKVKEFQYPRLKFINGLVNIKGSILGTDIMSYRIEIGSGVKPSTWDTLGNFTLRFMKKGTLLRGFDSRAYKDGLYTLRLTAVNSLGEEVYDEALININN